MQFHFQCPVYWGGRQAAEIDMLAEISGCPDDPIIDALYVFELAPGQPKYELKFGCPEYAIAMHYLISNPQEQQRIADEWPDDERPRALRGHEHSTLWSALR